MTQKIFDTDNAEDMALLWSILLDDITKLTPTDTFCITSDAYTFRGGIIKINWHDKTEIVRPIQEATEADIGKLCYFWEKDFYHYGILTSIGTDSGKVYYVYDDSLHCNHCRRLTRDEIRELC